MENSTPHSLIVLTVWAITAPGYASLLVSLAAFFYFVSMLYYKVVKKHHNGSWKAYFTCILKAITRK